MSVEGDVRDVVLHWAQAVKERDMPFLHELLGEEFVLVTGRPGHERRSRAEWLRVTRDEYEVDEFAFDELDVHVYGEAALVRSRYRQRGRMGGRDRSQAYLMSDVLVRRGGAWRAVHRHVSRL